MKRKKCDPVWNQLLEHSMALLFISKRLTLTELRRLQKRHKKIKVKEAR